MPVEDKWEEKQREEEESTGRWSMQQGSRKKEEIGRVMEEREERREGRKSRDKGVKERERR